MEITTFLASLCLLSLIFFKLISVKKRSPAPPLPPGPAAFPFVGSLPQMLTNKPVPRWIHNLMQQHNTEIACIKLGGVHVISVTSPELSREFLKKHDAFFASRPDILSARLASDGYQGVILSPSGSQWKKMRRVMASEVLTVGVFLRLHGKRCEEADHLVRYVYNQWNNVDIKGVVNLRDVTQHHIASVSRKMVFGERFFGPGTRDGGPGIEEKEHVDGLFMILSCLYAFGVADFVPWLEVLDLDGHKRVVTNALKNVRKYQDSAIDKRMKMWNLGYKSEEDDILDILINLRNSENEPLLSIREIKALIVDIMLASVDNPSNAVEWAMAEMINQPDLLAKACKELDSVVDKKRLVQESDIPKLNYVKACLKESFRLHPLAPFNAPHISSKDTVVGGYLIPEKSYVVLSRPGLGRNPRIWDEPLRFKPERHIFTEQTQVGLADHDLRILSFSTGRRGCPGFVLGSTMTIILLARLIQGFSWRPPLGRNNIDLAESSGDDGALDKPLIVHATPRLDPQVYL